MNVNAACLLAYLKHKLLGEGHLNLSLPKSQNREASIMNTPTHILYYDDSIYLLFIFKKTKKKKIYIYNQKS